MLGNVFRLVFQNEQLAEQVGELLSGFETTRRPARAANILQVTGLPGSRHRLYKNCLVASATEAGADLVGAMISAINSSAIEQCAQFAVHSAVVALGSTVVAIPAESGGGKSTLAAACVLSGFSYISDEALVFDAAGSVVRYPKPMALSPWSCETLGLEPSARERIVTPGILGGSIAPDNSKLTDLVLAEYGHKALALEEQRQSAAVGALLTHAFNHYKNPEHAFHQATETARQVRVWTLRYDDPLEAAATLSHRLAR